MPGKSAGGRMTFSPSTFSSNRKIKPPGSRTAASGAGRHNAEVFLWRHKRMGEFIPRLVEEGENPRIMIDYSGALLHGLRQMAAHDEIDSLRTITCDPRYRRCVEWLGAPWLPVGFICWLGANIMGSIRLLLVEHGSYQGLKQ